MFFLPASNFFLCFILFEWTRFLQSLKDDGLRDFRIILITSFSDFPVLLLISSKVILSAQAAHINKFGLSNFGSGFFGTTAVVSANADANGHGIFEYTVPTGFYTLNTKNIKEFG